MKLVIKFRAWFWRWQMQRGLKKIYKMPADKARTIVTRWRWQVSQLEEGKVKEAFYNLAEQMDLTIDFIEKERQAGRRVKI